MASHNLHIKNTTNKDLYVLTAPNLDFVFAEFAFTVGLGAAASLLPGLNLAAGTGLLASVLNTVSSVPMLRRVCNLLLIFGKAKRAWELQSKAWAAHQAQCTRANMAASEKELNGALKSLIEFFDKNAAKVPAGQTINVLSASTGIWGPTSWASSAGASDVFVLVVAKDFSQSAGFNSNSDYSWIVDNHEIVRAKYGTLSEPCREEGYYRFSLGDTLVSGACLLPGESISSLNGDWNFVYRTDGRAALSYRGGRRLDEANCSHRCHGSGANSG